jgi:hypothetical protein
MATWLQRTLRTIRRCLHPRKVVRRYHRTGHRGGYRVREL